MAKIKMPNGHTVFLDNSVSDYHARLALVQEHILGFVNIHGVSWEEYFDDAWFRETSVAGRIFNQSMDTLDRAATYLLMGQFEESKVLTLRAEKIVAQKEIPLSSAPSDAHDLIYGAYPVGDADQDKSSKIAVSSTLTVDIIDRNTYDMSVSEIEQQKKKARKSKKRWKQTRTYKFNRLYSTPAIRTYRVKPVKDQFGKTIKDVTGKPVLDAIYVTIGGHKGLFNKPTKFQNVPDFIANWCTVNTENIFTFNGNTYHIDENVKQYTINGKASKNDSGDWNNFTNSAVMERILCYELNGEIYFYDEEINPIDRSAIKEVA